MSVDLSLKDCRSDAVPALRQKEKKARYKFVDPALMGQPTGLSDCNQQLWTEKNKYKMHIKEKANTVRLARSDVGHKIMAKSGGTFRRERQAPGDYDLGSGKPRKEKRSKHPVMMSSIHSEIDDGTIPGVEYSFDAYSGPSHGEDVWGKLVELAEVKYDNKVFDNLVKTEYEMVETTSEEDTDDEFELIDM